MEYSITFMIALSSLKQDEYEAGLGIAIDTANDGTKVISNTGVVTLSEGANISITDLGDGNFEITSSAGGDITAVSEIVGGNGIQVSNPTGPTATITNTGALGLVAGSNVSVSNNSGYWTVNAANAPITTIAGGSGIFVSNGNGPIVSVANTGVISTVAGTGISISGTSNPTISNTGVLSASAGSGISVTGTSNPVIANTGVISLTAGTNTTPTNLGNGTWKIDASFPSYTQSTYTVLVRGHQNIITVPAGAQFADVMVISAGGDAGANDTSDPPLTVYGGSGAGGTTCVTYKIPVRQNQQFRYDYGTTFSRVFFTIQNYSTFTKIADVPPGGSGEPGSNLGSGGQPGGNPTLSTSFAWTYNKGSAGQNGFSSAPTTAGSPYMRPWVGPEAPSVQVDVGCGARTSADEYGRGALYVTFYLV